MHGVSTVGLLSAAVAGVFLRRREGRTDAILWSILGSFVLVHTVYFPATRYTAPVLFVLLFYAAVGVEEGLRLIARRQDQAWASEPVRLPQATAIPTRAMLAGRPTTAIDPSTVSSNDTSAREAPLSSVARSASIA